MLWLVLLRIEFAQALQRYEKMAWVLLSAQHCLPTNVLSNVFGLPILFQRLRSYDTTLGLSRQSCSRSNPELIVVYRFSPFALFLSNTTGTESKTICFCKWRIFRFVIRRSRVLLSSRNSSRSLKSESDSSSFSLGNSWPSKSSQLYSHTHSHCECIMWLFGKSLVGPYYYSI